MNLQRLLVERIEHRIIVGTVAFLAIMVLVGWIAINENGRMQAFQRQYEARAIERGAALFTSNCAPCHGEHGLGSARAPALNSPLLFGYDYIADYHKEKNSLKLETDSLNAELALADTTDARKAEINARLSEINTRLAAMDTEIAPILQQMQPAIDKGYNPDTFSRLNQTNWGSSVHNFIVTTVTSGRPTSSSYWPAPMSSWSQLGGGPLRTDEIEDLATYILNWDKGSEWTIDDLLAVNQFPKVPVEGTGQTAVEGAVGMDTPIDQIMTGLADVTGDPQVGQTLYDGSLGCSSCHLQGIVGPITAGTWTRVTEVRLQQSQFAGYTGEQYIAESIIHPSAYVVPNFADAMVKDFGSKLTYQNLADLIAYLKTQDQPSS